MKISEFLLEKYFAKYEFTADYMFSSSDCDGYSMNYVLSKADEKEKQMWNNLHLGYTETSGSPYLRESIQKYYNNITPDDIIVSSPGELSFITMNILMQDIENPHAVVVSPAYQSLYEVLESLGCDISYWKVKQYGGEWKFNIEELKSLVKSNTRLIVINFPHNPTGACITQDQMNEIVDIARSCGAYIYSDEMYRDLIIDNSIGTLVPMCDIYEKGISLWGMAKSFGLAGVRIGWLACRDKALMQQILMFKHYLSMCCSAPSEILSAIVLNHKEVFLTPNIDKIKKNVELFKEAVEKGELPWVAKFIPPKAGSVALVELNCNGTAMDWSTDLVNAKSILTVPSELFEYPGKFIRVGFGRENFPQVLDMLKNK